MAVTQPLHGRYCARLQDVFQNVLQAAPTGRRGVVYFRQGRLRKTVPLLRAIKLCAGGGGTTPIKTLRKISL